MLKNNNKGYFLAETIIVLTVVALAISTLYVNSMESYVKEKNELTKYNTVDGLYSANAVKKYLYKYVSDFKVNANSTGYVDVNNYLSINYNKVSDIDFFKELNVKQLYFSTYDMSKLIRSGVLTKNIQKELSSIENDSKCVYRYIVIYKDYSYSLVGVSCGEEEEETQTIAKFNYTGSEQTYTVPMNGYYKIEAWGAQGGDITGTPYNSSNAVRGSNLTYYGGRGAYTYGEIYLEKGTNLYIQVGGAPNKVNTSLSSNGTITGGYNGGASIINGQQAFGSPGGGATDIRLSSGTWNDNASLKSRIMVAAGGGGANFRNQGYGEGNGGAGGTLQGVKGLEALVSNSYFRSDYAPGYGLGTGGTQTSVGQEEHHLLNGQINYLKAENTGFGEGKTNRSQSGGGSGYYGGGSNDHGGAGGGSSYISGYVGCVAIASASSLTPKSGCTDGTTNIECSYHYSNKIFQNAKMVAGNDKMPNHDGTGTMIGNSGNGYAKISYCGYDQVSCQGFNVSFDYTGSEQTYIAPTDGYYNLEAWGAQGGNIDNTITSKFPTYNAYYGGYGGYSKGEIQLKKGDILYVNVGGKGEPASFANSKGKGGYNGGGSGGVGPYNYWFNSRKEPNPIRSAGGGGATHIATKSGILSSLENSKNQIILVSGGGGGSNASEYYNKIAGTGGGISGGLGYIYNGSYVNGGSQNTGYAFGKGQDGHDSLQGTNADAEGSGGGGGGFYGGYSYQGTETKSDAAGAGGSGYIGNSLLTNKVMYCYNCTASNDTSTKTVSTTNVSANPVSNYAKKGNGYAKITYCGYDQSSCNSN